MHELLAPALLEMVGLLAAAVCHHVRFQDYGAASRSSFEPGNNIGPAFEDGLHLKRNAVLPEKSANVVGNGSFPRPAGVIRVDTIDGNQICKCLEEGFWICDESYIHKSRSESTAGPTADCLK